MADAVPMKSDAWQRMVNGAPIGFFTLDSSLRIASWNGACTVQFTYDEQQIVGRDVTTLLERPDDAGPLAQAVGDVLAGAPLRRLEVRFVRADGLPLRTSLHLYPLRRDPLPPICAVACTDVTELRPGEGWLEARLRLMFEQAPLGICVASLTGVLLEVNPAYAQMLGYSAEGLRGRVALEFMVPEDLPYIIGQLSHTDKQAAVTFDHRMVRKDGRVIWCEATVAVLQDEQGKPSQGITFARDITEHRQALEDAARAREHMQHMQKLESLGVLAGGIAHDFNNMLCVIQGQAELTLLKLGNQHDAAKGLQSIKDAAQQAAELCRQLLAYSGRGRFAVRPVDLSALVRSIQHVLAVSVSSKGVLHYELGDRLPAVEADPAQLRQVLLNLVLNAAEALSDGEGTICVATGSTECDANDLTSPHLDTVLPAGTYVWLEVSDTGVGMDAAIQERLFEPFVTTKATGRGLGLAAVLGIVRGHRGVLKLRSAPGTGTTFRLLLPASDKQAVSHLAPLEAEGWKGQGSALVADDEPGVRQVLKSMLEMLGFTVVTAADGQEALEIFRDRIGEFALVVLDMTMPKLGGPAACRAMRQLLPSVRVVLASGYDEQDATRLFDGEEPPGFVDKPIRFANLRDRVREAIEGTKPAG